MPYWQASCAKGLVVAIAHPESDLNLNVLTLGADILRLFSGKTGERIVDDLLEQFLRRDVRRTPDHFFEALTFLYVTGLVEHDDYLLRPQFLDPAPKGASLRMFE